MLSSNTFAFNSNMDQQALQGLIGKRTADQAADDHDDDGGSSSDDNNPNKRPRTQEEKKLDRILANRRSARRSRERRKQLQDNLEKSVILLTRQNEDLSRENDMLKQELRVLMNVFNEKRNLTSAAVTSTNNFADNNNLRHELQLRMAAQAQAGGSNSLFPDRNTYAATLANSMQQNSFLQGAGQQMFNNPGLYTGGQGNPGLR
jgi:hypothetical protein